MVNIQVLQYYVGSITEKKNGDQSQRNATCWPLNPARGMIRMMTHNLSVTTFILTFGVAGTYYSNGQVI